MKAILKAGTATDTVPTLNKTEVRSSRKKDITLNVGYKESMQRGFISLLIPIPLVAINHILLIYGAPVMFYLFTSALTHFCFVRYAWQHWVKHLPTPPVCDFAVELNIPVKAI